MYIWHSFHNYCVYYNYIADQPTIPPRVQDPSQQSTKSSPTGASLSATLDPADQASIPPRVQVPVPDPSQQLTKFSRVPTEASLSATLDPPLHRPFSPGTPLPPKVIKMAIII